MSLLRRFASSVALSSLAAVSCRGAADGTLENMDTLVRTYAAAKSQDGVWTLEREGGGTMRVRYAALQERSLRDLGGGSWGAVADFADEDAPRSHHAGVVVSMGESAWEVVSFRWLTKKQLPAFRAELAKRAEAFSRSRAGPPAPVGKPSLTDAAPLPPMNPGEKPASAAQSEVRQDALAAIIAANEKAYYDPARDGRKDLLAAMRLARGKRKRVLMVVGNRGCGWCRKLGDLFREDADIRGMRDRAFVTLHTDFKTNYDWLREYAPIQGTPHFLVLNAEGELLLSQDTGQLESGGRYDRRRVADFLSDWQPVTP